MTVHLFGAVSSPACANFALRQVVTDNKESYDEEVVKSVINKQEVKLPYNFRNMMTF